MRQVWALAGLTFRAVLSRRIAWAIPAAFGTAAFVLAMLWFFPSKFHLDEGKSYMHFFQSIVENFTHWLGLILSCVMGATLISQELSAKTLHPLLIKPLAPWKIITGKFLGAALLLAALHAGVALLALAAGVAAGSPPDWRFFPLYGAMFLGQCVYMATALFLAQRLGAMAAGILTFLFCNPAAWVDFFMEMGVRFSVSAQLAMTLPFYMMDYLIPGAGPFVMETYFEYRLVPWERLGWQALYAAAFLTLLLGAAAYVFSTESRYASSE